MTPYVQVLTTVGKREEAQQIARGLVESRLAACVQVLGPIESTYHWQGAIETAEEWQCLAKTRLDRYAEVEHWIRQSHSYQTPEILATPILAGNVAYLNWLEAELVQ